MERKKYPRANYRISYCTSEDAQYPASELLLQSPDAKGWLSKRFCSYPQIIIIQLVEPFIVKQVSILSHHSKIATKIQIESKTDPNKEWKRLGYMSLQSNANTNYQARQLRTVKISDITSFSMRLTLHANYVNNHNIFNQVGIVSFCIFGEKFGSRQDASITSQGSKNLTGTQFDKNTLNKLRMLQVEKREAVDCDDFQKAKQIKQQIDRIKNIGYALLQLQQKKQQAIRNQNYDDAKVINDKIKRLRDSYGGGPNVSREASSSANQYYKQQKSKTPFYEPQQQYHEQAVSPITNNMNKNPPERSRQVQPKVVNNEVSRKAVNSANEDRPLDAKNPNINPYQNAQDQVEEYNNDRQAQLEPLSKQLRATCSEYFQAIDEEIFRYIFSKSHANRETGLQMAKQQLQRSSKNKDFLANAGLFIVKSTVDDKVVGILTGCLDLFQFIMKRMKPQNSPQNMSHIEYILQRLADFLGHNNVAVKNTSVSLFQDFPRFQITNKDLCYRCLTMVSKRQKPPKILAGRLKAIQSMVRDFKLGKNFEQVIKYAVKYVDDKNNEVRAAAISLICAISGQIGYPNLGSYLKNVRPQIVKTIEEKLGDPGFQGDDRPIKAQNERAVDKSRSKDKFKPKNQFEEPMQGDNQFIQVSKKNKPQYSNSDYVCQFCQRQDKRFENENYRDLHLYNACPMIIPCQECGQAIQISCLTSHRVGQCKNSKYFKKCPRCKQAVHQRNYKIHVESKECLPAKAPAMANRCPLCHLDISSGSAGWKRHLVDEGCDNNPRK